MAAKKPKVSGDEAVRSTIAGMSERDRAIAERLDAVIREAGPELSPRLWYGQPAYEQGGKVICFFRGADVDKERYLTFGFSGNAQLDDGDLWATAFAVTAVSAEVEAEVARLVAKAVG